MFNQVKSNLRVTKLFDAIATIVDRMFLRDGQIFPTHDSVRVYYKPYFISHTSFLKNLISYEPAYTEEDKKIEELYKPYKANWTKLPHETICDSYVLGLALVLSYQNDISQQYIETLTEILNTPETKLQKYIELFRKSKAATFEFARELDSLFKININPTIDLSRQIIISQIYVTSLTNYIKSHN